LHFPALRNSTNGLELLKRLYAWARPRLLETMRCTSVEVVASYTGALALPLPG
jgi:hypothetical protein